MFKVIVTNAVISKGYNGAPALRFSENGENVRFRFGKKVYDPRAENNTKWINMSAKAFDLVCERIKKMQLKEGSFVNLSGRIDEDVWEDTATRERKNALVVILDEIEYCSFANKANKDQGDVAAAEAEAAQTTKGNGSTPQESSFTGYEPFSVANAPNPFYGV